MFFRSSIIIRCSLVLAIVVMAIVAAAQYATFSSFPWIAGDYGVPATPPVVDNPPKAPDLGVEPERPGTLEITVDDGVEVTVNGQSAGVAPVTPLRLKPGTYDLKYRYNKASLGEEQVTVVAGEVASNSLQTFLGTVDLFLAPAFGATMQLDGGPEVPAATRMHLQPGNHRLSFRAGGYEPQTVFVAIAAGSSRSISALLKPLPTPPPRASTIRIARNDSPVPVSAPSNSAAPPVSTHAPASASASNNTSISTSGTTAAKGTLAVSSLQPVDIYLDNRKVGSTPVSLEFPPGRYTFEYRLGALHKRAVHVVKADEVIRERITFDLKADIDSIPASEVSLEGVQQAELGRTPLRNIQLPVGSVLVFRAPSFPEKRHTVIENDKTIRMVFP